MTPGARTRLYLRQALAEGAPALWARWRDRQVEARRARRFQSLTLNAAVARLRAAGQVPDLVNLLGTPPWLRLGGVQMQLRSRLLHEQRPLALLYPQGDTWRLELQTKDLALVTTFERSPAVAAGARDASLEAALGSIGQAFELRAGHVENLAGLPARSLAAGDWEWVASLHDYAAYCPRPTLIEQPQGRFCDYSRDALRCAACLASGVEAGPIDPAGWRSDAAGWLHQARALVFPSEFLRARMNELVPGLDRHRQRVLAPSLDALGVAGSKGVTTTGVRPLRHVAFVGAARLEKGVQVFEQAVRRLGGQAHGVRFSAYGGGTPASLDALRRAGVRVRGFHQPGRLVEHLRAGGVDVALLLSIWPETYALTLDECVAAGVWTLAFDLGALGARVRDWQCGQVLPLAAGAAGVASALEQLRVAGVPALPAGLSARLPRARDAADAHLTLYRELGWLGPASGARRRSD